MISRVAKLITKPATSRLLYPASIFGFSKDKQNPINDVSPLSNLSTNDSISRNVGMNKFLSRVYNTTGLALLGALSTSYAVLTIPALSAMMSPLAMGGLASMLIGYFATGWMKPTYYVEKEKLNFKEKIQMIKSKNSPLRLAMFALGTIGLGLSGAPLMAFATAVSPTIVPTALGLTTAIFGGASLIAYRMPKDSMLSMGKVLFGSLFGLIGLQLVGLATSLVMGPNPFSLMLLNGSTYISVGLFSAFIAYDTHAAIKMYELGQADHVGMAAQFVLDFWNILMSIIRILANKD